MKKILAILMILCCALPTLAKVRHNEEIITPLTQLEKRQFQTRTYNTQDNILAMKSILNVLQDEGFIVYNVNSLLGFIYGVKDFDMKDPNIDISKEFGVTKSRLNYNGVNVATLEVSVNVTPYGEKSRIRANFKRKLLNQYGNAQMINDIDEAEFYDEFFAKVDKALNMQKEIQIKLTPENVNKPAQEIEETKPTVTKTTIKEEKQDTEIIETTNLEGTTKIEENNHTGTEEETITNEVTDMQQTSEEETITNEAANAPQTSEEESIPDDNQNIAPDEENQESATSEKELKKLMKQAKEEAKQAEKEAKEAAKEAHRIEKETVKAQKEALKEMKKEEKQSEENITE